MSEDPINVYSTFCPNVVPSPHNNLWCDIAQPRLCFADYSITSQQRRGCYIPTTGDAVLVYNSGDQMNLDRRVNPSTRAGAEEAAHDVAQMSGIIPNEYRLFGILNPLNAYAASLTNHAVSTAADPTQSVMPKPLHRVPTTRQQHYHQRHHAQAKHQQTNNLKNKTRFSATGLSSNYMIVRDTKMFLPSAPSSPSAGSVGGSLGNNYLLSHPPMGATNAFCVPQYKGSSSSSSSCCSTTGLKISSSSLSSYSSRSSMPSMPSLGGNSPRKRRADDSELRCRKGYVRPSESDIPGLCSCETCLAEEVSARVNGVTIRDVRTTDRNEQQHKRSKNDDVVFVSAEPGPGVLTKRKVRPVRKQKKTNRKAADRSVDQHQPQPQAGFQSFVVVPPRQSTCFESKDGSGRYFLRSAAKGRRPDDPIPTSPPQPAAFVQLSGNETTPTNYGVDADSSIHGISLQDNGATITHGPEKDPTAGTPRYHTRSRQKKTKAGQRKPRVQPEPPIESVQSASGRAEDYHVASVIQAAVQASNRSKQQYVPASPQSPSPTEAARETRRSSSYFKKLYDIHGIIGVGGGGTVFAGTRKSDGEQVAVKQVPKAKVKRWGRLDGCTVPIEFELLRRASRTGHPGVIGMLDWFERRNTYILVMERPQPVIDLFDYLNQHGALSEASARNIFRQIAEAVLHCHAQGVVHRDIKDENVILNLYNSKAKLIDFGCGTVLKNTPYTEFAGTPEFYPPEWFTHRRYYGERVDAWSLGVLLYTMVEAEVPFQKEQDIVECKIRYKKGISDSCKNLIAWMLRKEQNERPTIQEMLSHPWIHAMDAPLFVGPNTQAKAPTPLTKAGHQFNIESSTESPDRPAKYVESQPSPPYQRPFRDGHLNVGVYQTGCVAR